MVLVPRCRHKLNKWLILLSIKVYQLPSRDGGILTGHGRLLNWFQVSGYNPPTLALAREDREDVSLHPSLSPYLKVSISIYQKLTYAWAVSEVSILSHYFLLVFWFWLWNPVLFGWFRFFVCFVSVPQVQEVRLVVFLNSWHPVLLEVWARPFSYFIAFPPASCFPTPIPRLFRGSQKHAFATCYSLRRWRPSSSPPTVHAGHTTHPEVESISLPLESGLPVWLASTNRKCSNWQSVSSGPSLQETWKLHFSLLEAGHQAVRKSSYPAGERDLVERPGG